MYEWVYLDRPPVPVPDTAQAKPEVSADGRTWTIRIKPGILFTDDPAFGGKPRELTAQDYVYSIKRYARSQPARRRRSARRPTSSSACARWSTPRASPARASTTTRRWKACARSTATRCSCKFDGRQLSGGDLPADRRTAVAREVVEAAGGDIQARAVGHRALPARRVAARLARRARGQPGLSRARVSRERRSRRTRTLVRAMQRQERCPRSAASSSSVIDEQPMRLLEFDRGKLDVVELRGEGRRAVPDERRARSRAGRARHPPHAVREQFVRSLYVNMEDPVLGGMTRERIALRRAISLAIDVDTLIRVVYDGQGMRVEPDGAARRLRASTRTGRSANTIPCSPGALLDRMGYAKRDAQGFRLAPDGKPLTVVAHDLHRNGLARDPDAAQEEPGRDRRPDRVPRRCRRRTSSRTSAQGKFQFNIHGRSAIAGRPPVPVVLRTDAAGTQRVALPRAAVRPRDGGLPARGQRRATACARRGR